MNEQPQETEEKSWRERLNQPLTGYAGVVVLLVSISLSLAALLIGLSANERSENRERAARLEGERAWCAIVVTMDDTYRETPPSTQAGKNLAEGMRALRERNCPPQSSDRPLPSITKSD